MSLREFIVICVVGQYQLKGTITIGCTKKKLQKIHVIPNILDKSRYFFFEALYVP